MKKKFGTAEELKEHLSHIENEVRSHKNGLRRYYRMQTPPENEVELVNEATSVLFPEYDINDGSLTVEALKYLTLSKIEIIDGVAWVCTLLV
jgi:hypothetical protein